MELLAALSTIILVGLATAVDLLRWRGTVPKNRYWWSVTGGLQVGLAIASGMLFFIHPSWVNLITTVGCAWLGTNALHRAMQLSTLRQEPDLLPLKQRHGDFRLNKGIKIVPFLKEGEYYFIGEELIQRAQLKSPIVDAGQTTDLLQNQDKIPPEFREYSFILPSLWYDRYVDLLTGVIPIYRLSWDEAKKSWGSKLENIDLIGCDANTRFLRVV